MKEKIKAAFLDRDGTLIKEVNFLSNLDQIEILPGAVELCLFLQKLNYKLFVVTNQSGIARGYFDEIFVEQTHLYLQNLFEKKGVLLHKFYFCPHHPTAGKNEKYLIDCCCRKPKSGMLLQASKEFDIDLSKSLMFGDNLIDIQAGQAAGCKSFYIQDILSGVMQKMAIEKIINI